MTTTTVFHEGEQAVQERAGAAAQGENSGRLIADAIIPGAIKFVKRLPLLVAGSVDRDGNLWTSMLVGEPGFMTAEPRSVDIDLDRSLRVPRDPLWTNLRQNPSIGLLAIDLRSRARLRINGYVESPVANLLRVNVEQAYPNCPQYIQRRDFRPALDEAATSDPMATEGTSLSYHQQAWIDAADTLFVSSAHPSRGVDASHRGGNPGFIQVLTSTRLRIPDYAGNGMFNTLGNFAVNPRAGLIVPDFQRGRTLQLTGRTQILWDVDDPAGQTGGTRRYWEFAVEKWVEIAHALPGTVEFLDYSPLNPSPAS